MDLHPQTVFEAIGGEAPLRRLVDAFYDRMHGAMRECAIPQALQDRLLTAFFQTADWMRNQAG